jgi:hypothetical protein
MNKGIKYMNASKLHYCKYNPNSNQTVHLDFSNPVNDRYINYKICKSICFSSFPFFHNSINVTKNFSDFLITDIRR